jgi:rRNA maturation endonuclease Nob1
MGAGLKIGQAMAEGMTQQTPKQSIQDQSKPKVKCPKCGAEIEKNSKFCNNCGAKIIQTQNISCPKCNTTLSDDSKFCNKCGTIIGE